MRKFLILTLTLTLAGSLLAATAKVRSRHGARRPGVPVVRPWIYTQGPCLPTASGFIFKPDAAKGIEYCSFLYTCSRGINADGCQVWCVGTMYREVGGNWAQYNIPVTAQYGSECNFSGVCELDFDFGTGVILPGTYGYIVNVYDGTEHFHAATPIATASSPIFTVP